MWIFVLLCCVGLAEGYKDGQVGSVCGSMMPGHGSSAQNSAAPFSVTADKSSFKEGDVITVTVAAQSQNYFEGIMLQARRVGQSGPIGTFAVTGSFVQTIDCSGLTKGAVTHTSDYKKNTIQATWTAPSSGQLSNIEFQATVLKSYATFWMNVKSPAVSYTGTGTPFVSNATVSSNPDCGTTKVCFSQPSNCDPNTNTGCFFLAVQSFPDQAMKKIEMIGKADGYVAIGFSDDNSMGNDDVYICGKNSSGILNVQHAYNTGKRRPTILELGNVTNIVTSMTNGQINCSFTSRNAISTASRAASTEEYFLMIAGGSTSGDNIQYHTDKFISTAKVNLLSPGVATSGEQFPAIVKAHGCLMLIAWMTTGSLGMLIARYLKGVAKGQGCFGKDFWFVAHVLLMSLSVTATAIAFIIVFAYAQDWAGGAHPVLGCLVMILSLIQPIVAAFRCDPQHERRFVFNWAHSFIAFSVKCLAVAAIFTGLELIGGGSEDGWMMKVMGGFVAWEAIMYVLQDLNLRAKKKDTEICGCGSMKAEVVLLVLFLIGNLAFLIALLVGIGSS